MAWTLDKTVAMVGMMGSGKSAIGTAVARLLDVPFLDSDAEIEAASNLTIAEIFQREGETFFRAKESQVLSRLLDGAPVILSTGGGAFLTPANRAMISERGVSVWLRADVDLLWSRVRHKDTRPLLRTSDPLATLGALHAERTPYYAKADLVVDAQPDYSIQQMAEKVIETLQTRPDVLKET
ncbi:MAG: shikimate kinase [Rhodobacteraceae bacterium]|nr:shikimate kinase [Paracoccaceae bacterium]